MHDQRSVPKFSHSSRQHAPRSVEQNIPRLESSADEDCMSNCLALGECLDIRASVLERDWQRGGLEVGVGDVGIDKTLGQMVPIIHRRLDLELPVLGDVSRGTDRQLVENTGLVGALQQLAGTAVHVAKIIVGRKVVIYGNLAVTCDLVGAALMGAVESHARVEDVLLSVVTRKIVDSLVANTAPHLSLAVPDAAYKSV